MMGTLSSAMVMAVRHGYDMGEVRNRNCIGHRAADSLRGVVLDVTQLQEAGQIKRIHADSALDRFT